MLTSHQGCMQQQHRQQQCPALLGGTKASFKRYRRADRTLSPKLISNCKCTRVLSAARPPSRCWCAVVAAASMEASTAASLTAPHSNSDEDWRLKLLNTAFQPGQLVRLVLKAKVRGDDSPVIVKPAASSAESPEVKQNLTAPRQNEKLHGSESFGAVAAGTMPYKQLTMRPVLIKGQHLVQVSILTARQVGNITICFTSDRSLLSVVCVHGNHWNAVLCTVLLLCTV